MHHVSLIIEFLRGRPKAVFWAVALTQAVLWTAIPAIFYSAPPGNVPLLLAIGHEFMLGSYLGPPLAFWLAEVAFRAGGMLAFYALSQACIVIALWAVFTLGRAIAGTRHAVLAILLMVGIGVFTVPTPEFGPAILAAPLWALAVLHYWRAVGEDKRGAWFLLALDLGLLLLSNYAGVVLLGLLAAFTLATWRGRRALGYIEPWLGALLFIIVVLPHAIWLYETRDMVIAAYSEGTTGSGLAPWLSIGIALVASQLGLALLLALASGWPRQRRDRAPEIDRPPIGRLARSYVYFFALAPGLAVLALTFATGNPWPLGSFGSLAPLMLMSGLAVVIAAGNRIPLYRERLVSSAWLGLLVAPPVLAALSLVIMPLVFARDLRIAQPAKAEAQFFADNFTRRTGKQLEFITGDERLAPLIALMAPNRPQVFFAWAPQRSPWVSVDDVARKGGVLVWPAGNTNAPPDALKAQFPSLVAELPRAFDRTVQGRLPPVRLGWSVLRPQPTP